MSDETNSRPALPHSRTAFQDSKDGSIKDNSGSIAQGGNAEVHDRTGLYISIIALLVAGMALGYEIAQSSARVEIRELQEQALDAKIKASIAPASAEANEAKVNGRVTAKEVDGMCAQLKATVLKTLECH